MSKVRAKDAELGELHVLLAKFYINKLRDGTLTAAEASSAVKFLKDNKIESDLDLKASPETRAAALPVFDDTDPDEDYQKARH